MTILVNIATSLASIIIANCLTKYRRVRHYPAIKVDGRDRKIRLYCPEGKLSHCNNIATFLHINSEYLSIRLFTLCKCKCIESHGKINQISLSKRQTNPKCCGKLYAHWQHVYRPGAMCLTIMCYQPKMNYCVVQYRSTGHHYTVFCWVQSLHFYSQTTTIQMVV